ncbi:MAG: PilZ domain-containing protein [Candidatus Omnitrophica bacterium]|nr:PilZ domain-containing protein [Candidatus Omnitrophota bacterium]
MQERRITVRITKNLETKYSLANSLLKSGSRTKNISELGIALPVLHKLEPETILDLEIKISNSDKIIRTKGKVVWSKRIDDSRYPFEVGIKFLNFSKEDLSVQKGHLKNTQNI